MSHVACFMSQMCASQKERKTIQQSPQSSQSFFDELDFGVGVEKKDYDNGGARESNPSHGGARGASHEKSDACATAQCPAEVFARGGEAACRNRQRNGRAPGRVRENR